MRWRKKPPTWPGPVGNMGGEIVPDRFDHEPIVGYRSWHVVPATKGVVLKSLHMGYIWNNPDTARCMPYGRPVLGPDHDPDDAPHPECSCGLYAQRPDDPLFDEWESMRTGRVSVFGTIELYGRVLICERGLKAQHARIVSGFFEVSCAKGHCVNPVVRVQPQNVGSVVLCWCTAHEPVDAKYGLVDADTWLGEAARLLYWK